MNSALVLSNRLHRESEMRRETTMKHIRIAFAVLKAVGLCYQPAQYWVSLNIVVGHWSFWSDPWLI